VQVRLSLLANLFLVDIGDIREHFFKKPSFSIICLKNI
jgi:hypothetical protein